MKLMRRSLVPLLLCVLALLLASQAVAGPTTASRDQGLGAAGQSFSCLGSVTAVDPGAGTITLTVNHATIALQGSIGQSLTLTVTADGAITGMEIEEVDGALTRFSFTAEQPNAPVPPDDFHFTPPPGVPVVDALPPV